MLLRLGPDTGIGGQHIHCNGEFYFVLPSASISLHCSPRAVGRQLIFNETAEFIQNFRKTETGFQYRETGCGTSGAAQGARLWREGVDEGSAPKWIDVRGKE